MDRTLHKSILLFLDGGRLFSKGILQKQHRDIDEILADDRIHTKIRELRASGRISDEHFHLLFPPTDLGQWDIIITSRFLKHCIDLEEQQRLIIDEIDKLRNKGMEMYQQRQMSDEECSSLWKRIVNIFQHGKTLLTGSIVVEIDETINRIEHSPVTHEAMCRMENWIDLETNYEATAACPKDMAEGTSVIHDAAFLGKLSTLKYVGQKFPTRFQEQDKKGNQAVHLVAERGYIDCLRYICGSFPEFKELGNKNEMNALHCAAHGGCIDCLKYLIDEGMSTHTRSKHDSTILHEATYGGSVSMVQYIYKTYSGLIKQKNKKGQDALFTAVRGGSLDCLTFLIDHGMTTDTLCNNGNTLLHEAAFRGLKAIVMYLCEKFPELKQGINKKGQRALNNAALGGSLDCVKYLVRQGMDTYRGNKAGYTLLHDATYGRSVSVVKYIWETFPKLRYERNEKGMDALLSAAKGGSLGCLQYLRHAGMNTETRSKHGNTLLHDAAVGGTVTIVQYICETIPELINERNENGQDALHSAAYGGRVECLLYLIGQGMNPYTRSEHGNTLLHDAAYGGSVSMVRYIWETYPEQKYEMNKIEQDVIHCAALSGDRDCLKFLIDQGMKTDTRSEHGNTLLHAAAFGGSVSMVRYIWETFPGLRTEISAKGQDALFSVACGGNLESFKYLISQGMTIDTQSKHGQLILHQAVFYGHELLVRYICETYNQHFGYGEAHAKQLIFAAVSDGHLDILKYLLSQNIDPKLLNKKGYTILHVAAMKGKTDVVRYLCTTYRFLIPLKAIKGETARELAHRNGIFDCAQILEDLF